MVERVNCPACNTTFETPARTFDRLVRCRNCGHQFPVRGAPDEASGPKAASAAPAAEPERGLSAKAGARIVGVIWLVFGVSNACTFLVAAPWKRAEPSSDRTTQTAHVDGPLKGNPVETILPNGTVTTIVWAAVSAGWIVAGAMTSLQIRPGAYIGIAADSAILALQIPFFADQGTAALAGAAVPILTAFGALLLLIADWPRRPDAVPPRLPE